MDFLELAQKRYSARGYKPDPVEDSKLQAVLEAARIAPTAANCQPFQIILVRTHGREAELKRIYQREWFIQAPLVFCICALPKEGWVRSLDQKSYADVDVAIVMDHMSLAAASLDLGTCWIASFNVAEARSVLGLPEDVEPVVLSPLGYPNDTPRPKARKSLVDLVRYEHW